MTDELDPSALALLPPDQLAFLDWQARWVETARPEQLMPPSGWTECGVLAGRGYGKALALDTRIATPSGWTTMGQLRDGDRVFDEAGRPCTVLKAHDVLLGRDCYAVRFDDGSEIVADGEHLWATISRADRRAKRGPRVRTTTDIRDTLRVANESNHAVPVARPLELAHDASLPIDPYLLGLWLGDGSSAHAAITTADPEIVRAFEDGGYVMRPWATTNCGRAKVYGITTGQSVPRDEATGRFSQGGFPGKLRELGLTNNKHIPLAYLRAAAGQRMALLQGLVDSDGHIDPHNGQVEIVSVYPALAQGILELVLTLGFKARMYEHRAQLGGVDKGPRFRVCWQADRADPVARLPRKLAARQAERALASRCRYIVAVTPVPSVPVRCITVDSESHLYLAGPTLIPTHNTRVGAEWLGAEAFADPLALPRAVIAPTQADVRFTCFEGESGLLNVIPPECVANYNRTDLLLTMTNGATIRGFSAEKADRLRGPQHADVWCFVAGTQVAIGDGRTRPIETLKPGDYVMTRKGLRRVLANSARLAQVGRVGFSTGAELIGTTDHPVYTSSGWTDLSRLQSGDEVCAISASSGVGSGGTATEAGTTSGQTSPSGRSAIYTCTGRSGSTTTARSRPSTTFTTSTATGSTTTSAILSVCRTASTGRITPGKALSRAKTGARRLLLLASALTAARWCTASGLARKLCASPARTSGPKPSGRCLEHAIAAESLSDHGWATSAASVVSTWRPAGLQFVYCLKVEGEPEYFANGVLVHNCDELAAWGKDAEDTWDMMQFGLRLGPKPRALWTTTPKPVPIVRRLTVPQPGRIIIRGSTFDNKANLPDSFFKALEQYEGTKIGRQELYGELIDPEEAGIIKRSWFNLWPANKPLPRFDWIIMSLDTAYTEKALDKKGDPDPTACGVWGVFQMQGMTHIMLLDCWEDHLGLPDLMKRVKRELNTRYGEDADNALIKPMFGSMKPDTSGRKPDILLIEDKGSGISLRQMLDREGIQAYAYNPGRADKLTRLHVVSPVFAQRRVWLPESEKHPGRPRTWAEPLVAQLCAFAGEGSIKHDDHVDQTTQAFRLAMDKGMLKLVKVKPTAPHDRPPPKPVVNPYAQ